ncbi:unnamed protein product [Lactuca virosa]|uniref:IST1-like protein n=1 Tax=Lactuca virosa TaxID=75947 RepID=A0AAU9ML00_9ASTR|nr:unnamed protein product [Lactuca virosa]
MFDAILRSKFYSKCKSEIKMTRRRIEIIKRKRNAMQKFLRNDVADLLKNGLDSNAYSRVEQLYVDQNLSSCYEFVEQSCLLILNHLSSMDKQRECPEECKESISTLMFAAARFADLPELRELRSLFAERYGNSLEPYVNKEFVKNLKAETPSEDIKNVMMLEITLEYGIEWIPKASEHKLYKPPQFVQDSCEYVNERNKQLPKLHHQNGVETEKKQSQVAKKEHIIENEFPYKYKSWAEAEVETKNNKQRTGNSLPYKSRGEVEKKEKKEEEEVKVKHSPYWSSTSSSSSTTSQDDSSSSSSSSASEDVGGVEGRKFYDAIIRSTPPPYLKPDKYTLRSVGPPYIKTEVATNSNVTLITPPKQQPAVPRSMRVRRPLQAVSGSQGHNEISKATPKVSYDDDDDDEEEEENNKRVRERKTLNKLGCDFRQSVSAHAPTRITSLPVEVESSETEETKKGLARAVTDLSQGHGHGHVHPKLPDYDDFVARLAAFRATNTTS